MFQRQEKIFPGNNHVWELGGSCTTWLCQLGVVQLGAPHLLWILRQLPEKKQPRYLWTNMLSIPSLPRGRLILFWCSSVLKKKKDFVHFFLFPENGLKQICFLLISKLTHYLAFKSCSFPVSEISGGLQLGLGAVGCTFLASFLIPSPPWLLIIEQRKSW